MRCPTCGAVRVRLWSRRELGTWALQRETLLELREPCGRRVMLASVQRLLLFDINFKWVPQLLWALTSEMSGATLAVIHCQSDYEAEQGEGKLSNKAKGER